AADRGEGARRTAALEVQGDHPADALLGGAVAGVAELGSLNDRRAEQEPVAVLVTGQQRLARVVDDVRRVLLRGAGELLEPLLPLLGRVRRELERLLGAHPLRLPGRPLVAGRRRTGRGPAR